MFISSSLDCYKVSLEGYLSPSSSGAPKEANRNTRKNNCKMGFLFKEIILHLLQSMMNI